MYGKLDFFVFVKLFFKLLVVSVVLFVVGLFLWRFNAARVPAELEVLSPNDALAEVYAVHGESLPLMVQEQGTTTKSDKSYGYFTVCQAVFIPDAEQLQILIRYNDSTLEATERDYGLAEGSLDPNGDWYDVTLMVMRDKTPSNSEDNLIKNLGEHRDAIALERIHPTEVTAEAHTKLHSYRRLVFDGVTTDDLTLAIFADFYFKDDIGYLDADYDPYLEESYAALCLYAFTEEKEPRDLTRDDIAAIEAYMDQRG